MAQDREPTAVLPERTAAHRRPLAGIVHRDLNPHKLFQYDGVSSAMSFAQAFIAARRGRPVNAEVPDNAWQ